MVNDKSSEEVNYRPVAPDPAESCLHCKHFNPDDEGETGDCYGHKVSGKGTCNFWEEKQ